MANLTLSVDDDVLRRARIRVLEEGTSVNALVRDYLIRPSSSAVDDRVAGRIDDAQPSGVRSLVMGLALLASDSGSHRKIAKGFRDVRDI